MEKHRINHLNFTKHRDDANTNLPYYENFTELLIKDDLEA